MKKIIVSSLSVIALAILGTGCLKDKDYDNQVYGTQIGSNPAVSFPAAGSAESIVYGVISQATPYDLVGPHIAIEGAAAQSSDIHVNIAVQDALVDSANVHNQDPVNGNGIVLTILDPSEYTLNVNRTIVAGHYFDSVIITINNLAGLDPNNTYGIGLAITSVDNGFAIVAPQKSIVVQIGIRNKYDGVAELRGETFHPTNSALIGPVLPYEIDLETTGPNSVKISLGTVHTWATASGSALSGVVNPNYTVDPATNDVTVNNVGTDPAANVVTNFAGYHSYYDPASQTIFAKWTYNGRILTDTIVWQGPRP